MHTLRMESLARSLCSTDTDAALDFQCVIDYQELLGSNQRPPPPRGPREVFFEVSMASAMDNGPWRYVLPFLIVKANTILYLALTKLLDKGFGTGL